MDIGKESPGKNRIFTCVLNTAWLLMNLLQVYILKINKKLWNVMECHVTVNKNNFLAIQEISVREGDRYAICVCPGISFGFLELTNKQCMDRGGHRKLMPGWLTSSNKI